MTKQFRFRGVTKHDAKCRNSQLDLIKYAQASHIIFKIIWYQGKKETGLFNIRLSKSYKTKTTCNRTNPFPTTRITVTKPIKLLESICTARASFSITFNSLSLRTRPNSENNQLVLIHFYLHSFSLSHSSPNFNRMSSNSILAAENAHLSISPLPRKGK